MNNNQSLDKLKYIISGVMFGTIGTFLRFTTVPSDVVVFWRGCLGSILVICYLTFIKRTRIDWGAVKNNALWLVLSGITLGINWIVLFFAYDRISIAVASLCNYTAPIIFIIVAPLLLGEKLNIKKIPCIIVAFIGIVMVIGIGDVRVTSVSGLLFAFAAALCFVFILICNRKIHDIGSLDKTFVQLAISAITVFPYVMARHHTVFIPADTRSILIVLMLGLVHTGIGYIFYFIGIGGLPVQSVAILGYLEPVVAVFCSAFILHEPTTAFTWIGAALVIGSAIVSELIPDN